jgi:hypothetical protein
MNDFQMSLHTHEYIKNNDKLKFELLFLQA